MSNAPDTSPPPPKPVPPPATPPRRGCLQQMGGFLGWLFTLALSVALAVVAIGAIAFYYFGFDLQNSFVIRDTPNTVATLQAINNEAQAEIGLLQTEVALQRSRNSDGGERLDDLDLRIETLGTTIALVEQESAELQTLSQDLNENIALAATLQAEARSDQVQIAVFATIQADSVQRLDDLGRRTDRLTRFLERLGDIVGDTQNDLQLTPTAVLPELNLPTPTPTEIIEEEPGDDQ